MLPGATLEQQIATGFHRNTLFNEEGGTDPEEFRLEAVADRVDTTGSALLGLTLGCARCHGHKYDPISQREYYQIFAFLNNCEEPQIEAPSAREIERGDLDRRAAIRQEIASLEKELQAIDDQVLAAQLAWEKTITPEQRARLPGPTQVAVDKKPDERDEQQKKLVRERFYTTDRAKEAFPAIRRIMELRAVEPVIPTTLILRERSEPRETYVHLRGNFLDRGVRVSPGVPEALHPLPEDASTPDRLDFARWLVDGANSLTPRVTVNRFWQHVFGRGLVETENDFGTQGTPPTHPELLDWLATELIRRDWDVKSMLRLIVTAATYRQSSHHRADLVEVDPRNLLWARQTRLRLEAEAVRDTALAASGLLCQEIGGPSVHPPQPDGVFDFTQDPKPWPTTADADRFRRGMYTRLWRSSPYPAMTVFDFPDASVTCTRRVRSNTPLQALTLANDLVFVECAQALALRVLAESSDDVCQRTEHAFRLCLARSPSAAERERLEQLARQQLAAFEGDCESASQAVAESVVFDAAAARDRHPAPTLAAWTAVCRVLLNLDEFITRE
jgi:hypothetical protein